MEIRYLTIEREFGSGGTAIARETGTRCGLPVYGREIMEAVAKIQSVSISELEGYEERVSGSLLYSMFVMAQSQTGDPDLLSQEAKLFVAETRVIRELADRGPAIFVGHCASQALRDREGVLRVFIRGEEKDKEQRAIRDYGIPEREALSRMHRANKRRSSYYTFCTQKKWWDPRNYDLMLSSSALGISGCARVLAQVWSLGLEGSRKVSGCEPVESGL